MLRRSLVMWFLLSGIWLLADPRLEAAAPKLRPQSARLAALVQRGLSESATFRTLAGRIEQGDVIVYLESAPRLRSGLAACVTWMGAGDGVRYVRASIRPGLSPGLAVAILAHELQHVVEVIEHPDVRSEPQLAALYRRIGRMAGAGGRGWETVAALRTADAVRLELLG
jgi:hypothetical protein